MKQQEESTDTVLIPAIHFPGMWLPGVEMPAITVPSQRQGDENKAIMIRLRRIHDLLVQMSEEILQIEVEMTGYPRPWQEE